ncbi:MAG TPA: hypothetical protein VIJ14_08010 [Rhabdochlamydiaceae bacterium]
MEEVQTQNAEPEMVQDVEHPETETAQEAAPKESRQDRNWRELNRAKDEAERKVKMQDEMLARLMTSQQTVQQSPVEEDILADLAKEEYVGGEKVAKGLRKIEERFEKKLQAMEAKYKEKEQNSLYNSVKSEYADFDQVVTPETLDLIEETNPRLAASLAKTMKEDPYSFAIQSYEYIKAKGLSKKFEPAKKMSEVDKKIEQNKKTVQSPHAYDKRPMAKAFELTDDLKKDLQKEMYQYAQHAGMGY